MKRKCPRNQASSVSRRQKKVDVDHIIILVRTWRWQVRIADPIAHRTNPVGKTSEIVVQIWGHKT